jgi:hypothetical protein
VVGIQEILVDLETQEMLEPVVLEDLQEMVVEEETVEV